MALEETQEGIFRLGRFVFQGTFRADAVIGGGAGFDLAFLCEGDAQHVEGLVGGAFDGTAFGVEDFH